MHVTGPVESHLCVHEYFERQVRDTPHAPALVFLGTRLTYADLNARANRLAYHLRHLGVMAETTVGVALGWGVEAIVSILGILKAGGAYVPIDPKYPRERFTFVLQDSGCSIVLTDPVTAAQVQQDAAGVTALVWAGGEQPWESCSSANPVHGKTETHPRNLAYVIYTSGSTGKPKGVCVEHRNLMSFLRAGVASASFYQRTMLLTSLSFDASVAAIFGTLTSGGCLIVPAPYDLLDPDELSTLILQEQANTLVTVPSLVAALVDWQDNVAEPRLTSVQHIVIGGEPCPPSLVERHLALGLPGSRLYNAYGPTEATIWATMHPCVAADATRTVPIGRPTLSAHVHILDESMQPVATGETGEIFIGGPIVARGYLNRAELTAERFLPDPFHSSAPDGSSGARMYRTGDCGRWLENGEIEFVGRNDSQVKINGFRMELGEIETSLLTHPAVRHAVVIADEDGSGAKQLVAYYSSRSGAVATAALRAHMGLQLPRHMVPAVFVELQEFPLTPNGKLDRKALPSVNQAADALPTAEHGDSALLQRMFAKTLSLPDVSESADFFDIGGTSLSAMRLAAAVRQYGRELPLTLLYRARTPEAIARAWQAQPISTLPGLPTLFVIPGFGGDEPSLAALRAEWAGRINCVLLDYPDWAIMTDPAFGMAELEDYMMARITAAAQGGPVFIAGYSLGGPVAWIVASRLVQQGVAIGALIILDSVTDLTTVRAEQRHGLAALRGRLAELKAALGRGDRNAAAKTVAEMVGHRLLARPRLLRRVARMRSLRLPPMFRQWLHFNVSGGLQERIVSSYHRRGPGSPDLQAFLFRAGERSPGETFNLGWGALCRNLEVCVVKGDHYTLLNARDEASLYQLLPATLERVSQLRTAEMA